MDFDPVGRREFFVGTGGALICTLAGQKVLAGKQANVEELAAGVAVPPKVAAAERASAATAGSGTVLAGATGARREYWIRAESVRWNIVPSKRDQMMDEKVKGKTKFTAYAYRAYTPNFAAPLGPPSIPGPLLEVEEGETLVVNFRNALPSPVTMHPHGIFYANEMDGAYKGKFTDPGGFVQKNRTFQYVWEATPGTAGAWMYHDHGPMDPIPIYKGLFGPLLIRKPGELRPEPRVPALLPLRFGPVATGLNTNFSCVNGNAYAGNTPTLEAKVGDDVAFHVTGSMTPSTPSTSTGIAGRTAPAR